MPVPLRLCLVSPGAWVYFDPSVDDAPGGSEWQLYLLARELARLPDTEVTLCVRDHGQPARLRRSGVELRSFRTAPDLAGAWSLLRCLRAAAADVYLFRSASVGVAVGMLVGKLLLGRKVAYMVAHDLELQGDDAFATFDRSTRWAMGCAYRVVDRMLVQGLAQQAVAEPRFGRLAIVRNACPLPPAGDSERRYAALWVGRAERFKRCEELLALARGFPAARFLLVLPCSSDLGYWRGLRAAARELDNVDFRERLPRPELLRAYAASQVYVMTSAAEGFSNTMLEAMAAGCAVVSLSIDPDGLFRREGIGRCAGADAAALRGTLAGLLADPDARRALGARARAWVAAEHAPAVVAARLRALLAEL